MKKHFKCDESIISNHDLPMYISKNEVINNKIDLNSNIKLKYFPKNKLDLLALVLNTNVYLGDIDTSNITDMSCLFKFSQRKDFSGIECWNTSKVEDMSYMFAYTRFFNHPIQHWDISNVKNMSFMFAYSEKFNQQLDDWNISNVEDMTSMFIGAVEYIKSNKHNKYVFRDMKFFPKY